MKRIFLTILTSLFIATGFAQGIDLKSVLGGLKGGSSDDDKGLSAIGNVIGNLISSDKIGIDKLTGTWNYQGPGVSFKSDNLLMKAGGSAAASTVESKLAPYYKTAGIESMVLTVNADSTFTMSIKSMNLKGTISANTNKDSNANFIFNFAVMGKINIGKVDTYITMTGSNSMNLLFDVSKLATLIEKVASISGNSTAKGISSLLSNYDGICAGFKLTKSK